MRILLVGAGGERPGEDRRHELGLDGVHHVGGSVFAGDRCDRIRIGGVDRGRGEQGRHLLTVFRGDPRDGAFGSADVVVADDEALVERPPRGDLGNGVADTARADEEDSHARNAIGHGRRQPPRAILLQRK